MGAQQADEFIDPPGRMTESPNCRLPRHGAVWHSEQGIATAESQSGGIFSGSTSSSRSRPLAMCSVL